MEGLLSNGSSIYHRLVALYTRRSDGTLVHCTSPAFQEYWVAYQAHQNQFLSISSVQRTPKRLKLLLSSCDDDAGSITDVLFLERPQSSGHCITGIIVRANELGLFEPLDEFFMDLVLRSTQEMDSAPGIETVPENLDILDEQIVDLFDLTIRNVTPDDQWLVTGRELFSKRVRHFTSQGKKIELALPAFPCKSSNPNKVGGNLPDRGEMIALTNLHYLVRDIEALYSPGARIWIISDGHVFSDCIGVDDGMVDYYSKHLRKMNDALAMAFQDNGRRRVCFQSLTEMLQLSNDDVQDQALARRLDLGLINHHIAKLQINDDAESCRRLLMHGFKASTAKLRARILAQDPSTLALYRGFSRFMLEDLENNMYTSHLSKSQRRKVSSKVAFEMIERNQAYSNLVEMVFPSHIRLSIHAHNNAGPKFGINLMGPQVRATNTLPPDGRNADSCDLLHVPTPWHGCVVEIAGHNHLYLAKVEQVRAAIQEQKVLGAWVSPTIGKTSGSVAIGRPVRRASIKVRRTSSAVDAPLTAAFFNLIPTDMLYHI